MERVERLYETMYLIRKTEEKIEELFSEGILRGTTHGYIGEEAIATGVLENIDLERDIVTGTHRSHGHYLALTGDPFPLISELMGLRTGVNSGKGGSQHLSYKNFITNGITGGMTPIAVGMAFAEKLNKSNAVTIAFLGDGAMNEGYVMEALNLSAVYEVPILFVLENNGYAMSTRADKSSRGTFSERVKSFGLRYSFVDSSDVLKIADIANSLVADSRSFRPNFLEVRTHRFCGHSKNDKREYISSNEDEEWKKKDPISNLEQAYPQYDYSAIRLIVEKKIEDSCDKARMIISEGESYG